MEFVQDIFTSISGMGVEIFELSWIQTIVEFFRLFGWTMYLVALVIAIFDTAIAAQSGNGNFKDVGLSAIKGFFAASLFTILPIELYKVTIDIQGTLGKALPGMYSGDFSELAMFTKEQLTALSLEVNPINLFTVICLGYCLIKIFFANIKRGGILIINIAVGSLYIFGLTRSHSDGFIDWCKQVIAICVTAFLQNTLLFAGLLTFGEKMILGMGIMLAANEVPRIAERFGLDTSSKVTLQETYYAVRTAVSAGQSVVKMVNK